MKGNIILTHELEQLHILRVFPPLFPLICIVSSNGQIPYWSIKPNIKHLILKLLQRHGCPPFQVPCDAPSLQPSVDPSFCGRCRVSTPVPLLWFLVDPGFKFPLDRGQVQEDMPRCLDDWGLAACLALWVDQLGGYDELAAAVTLVSSGVEVVAIWIGTFASHVSVC